MPVANPPSARCTLSTGAAEAVLERLKRHPPASRRCTAAAALWPGLLRPAAAERRGRSATSPADGGIAGVSVRAGSGMRSNRFNASSSGAKSAGTGGRAASLATATSRAGWTSPPGRNRSSPLMATDPAQSRPRARGGASSSWSNSDRHSSETGSIRWRVCWRTVRFDAERPRFPGAMAGLWAGRAAAAETSLSERMSVAGADECCRRVRRVSAKSRRRTDSLNGRTGAGAAGGAEALAWRTTAGTRVRVSSPLRCRGSPALSVGLRVRSSRVAVNPAPRVGLWAGFAISDALDASPEIVCTAESGRAEAGIRRRGNSSGGAAAGDAREERAVVARWTGASMAARDNTESTRFGNPAALVVGSGSAAHADEAGVTATDRRSRLVN